MDLHTTSPGLSLSPGSPLDPAFLEDTLDEVRRHVDRANQELRFTVARLEMLHTERERLLEDARQLEEVVDQKLGTGPDPSAVAHRASARRSLRRFIDTRRGIARIEHMIEQMEDDTSELASHMDSRAEAVTKLEQTLREIGERRPNFRAPSRKPRAAFHDRPARRDTVQLQ